MMVQVVWSGVRRFLFWAIPLALVGTLVWTLLPRPRPVPISQVPPAGVAGSSTRSGGGAPAQEPAMPAPSAVPYAQIHQGDLLGTDDAGRPRWRIVADDVTVVQDKDAVLLRNVRATFYDKGARTITVTGATGRYETKTHQVDLEGGVHGTSSNGRELFADRVRWEPDEGRLTGIGHIRLIQESVIMYADQMTSDTTLGQTQFSGHVHAAAR